MCPDPVAGQRPYLTGAHPGEVAGRLDERPARGDQRGQLGIGEVELGQLGVGAEEQLLASGSKRAKPANAPPGPLIAVTS